MWQKVVFAQGCHWRNCMQSCLSKARAMRKMIFTSRHTTSSNKSSKTLLWRIVINCDCLRFACQTEDIRLALLPPGKYPRLARPWKMESCRCTPETRLQQTVIFTLFAWGIDQIRMAGNGSCVLGNGSHEPLRCIHRWFDACQNCPVLCQAVGSIPQWSHFHGETIGHKMHSAAVLSLQHMIFGNGCGTKASTPESKRWTDVLLVGCFWHLWCWYLLPLHSFSTFKAETQESKILPSWWITAL